MKMDSLVNKKRKRNLLEQIERLNSEYDKPLLIIEGESLYGQVEHVGAKTAKHIREVLSTEYRE